MQKRATQTKPQKKATTRQVSLARRRHDVEVEIKLSCPDLSCFADTGLELEQIQSRHFEDNWVYKLPDGKLRKGQYLRIRYTGNGDGAGKRHGGFLTYKGKSRRETAASKGKGKGKKVREEIETTIGQPNKVVKIFKRLGLERSFRYQKHRSVYHVTLGDGRSLLAMYDETPIGNFLELEGDAEVIEEVAKRLGYAPTDYITESYVEMQVARCAARGATLTDMLIEPKKPTRARKKTQRAPRKASRSARKPAKGQKKK